VPVDTPPEGSWTTRGTELVITLDADTLLHPRAVRQLVARLRARWARAWSRASAA
jgi:cellulose synthase/poly-beta-1,6-N-acetylglucosamine synthase-like glycosyltransferase